MNDRPPSLQDVAALAGVSHQTVSRVLNEHPHVATPTRDKVRRAMAELGYRRNSSARALATGRSDTIGVLAPHSMLYGPAAMVDGLGRALRDASMTFVLDHLSDLDEVEVAASVGRLLDQGVDGLLMVLPTDAVTNLVASVLPARTPFVAVDRPQQHGTATVNVDQHGGAVLATQHLLDQGHATVWHLAGPADWNDSRDREAGWRDTLAAAGAEVPPLVRGDWTPASGYEAGRVLARVPDCRAVFAANDHMALGLARALQENGRSIPDDVALVGFDGVPESGFYSPPLTTVHQDFAAVGRAGVELLLEQIAQPGAVRRSVLIPAVLLERSSSRRRA